MGLTAQSRAKVRNKNRTLRSLQLEVTMSNNSVVNFQMAFVGKIEEACRTMGLHIGSSKAHIIAGMPEVTRMVITELVQLGTSALNVPRSWIPFGGELGDTIHEYLNEAIRAFGGGLHEGLKASTLPKEELDKRIDAATKVAGEKLAGKTPAPPTNAPGHSVTDALANGAVAWVQKRMKEEAEEDKNLFRDLNGLFGRNQVVLDAKRKEAKILRAQHRGRSHGRGFFLGCVAITIAVIIPGIIYLSHHLL